MRLEALDTNATRINSERVTIDHDWDPVTLLALVSPANGSTDVRNICDIIIALHSSRNAYAPCPVHARVVRDALSFFFFFFCGLEKISPKNM